MNRVLIAEDEPRIAAFLEKVSAKASEQIDELDLGGADHRAA